MRLVSLLLVYLCLWVTAPEPAVVERNFQSHFEQYGLRGSFLMFDAQANKFTAYDQKRCRQGFLPASTFKIPNTLIGLETGVIRDTSQLIKWDGVKRNMEQWNRDLTLAQALRVSCFPCYQQVARGIGAARYQQWLPKLRFGRMNVTEATVDSFWLTGSSRISQFEQIDFLRRLHDERLPLNVRPQRLTKSLLLLKKTPRYRLYGKTGWSNPDRLHNNGWFVGWLERANGQVVYFALNTEPRPGRPADDRFIKGRRAITEKILADLKLL